MLKKSWMFFFIALQSFEVFAEEVNPDLRARTDQQDELEQQVLDLKKTPAPEVVPTLKPKKDFNFSNRSLLGSNFTYGNNSSFDIDLKTQSSLDYKKSRLENVLEFYTYYFKADNAPTLRYKGRFNGALKYLYEVIPHWSPFVGAKIEQVFERVNNVKNYTEKHSYDLGLRYDFNADDKFYIISEVSNRLIVENGPNRTNSYHNFRVYLASYYYPKPLGVGFWIESITPYSDLGDYWINFGPDLNYTFTGTSFFVGITANCSLQGKEKYAGDSLFDIWSGSFYTGVKF